VTAQVFAADEQSGRPVDLARWVSLAEKVLGDRAEATPALLFLGVAAMGAKPPRLEDAMNYFQRVERSDPSQAGTAMMWMGVVRERQKNFAEAESLFKSALAVQGQDAQAATTMSVYAGFLRKQGRADEAKAQDAAALALRQTLRKAAAPAPAPAAASNGVYRVGGGVTAPQLAYKTEPAYSEEARAASYQGTVILSVVIGTDGAPHNIQVLSSLGLGLDDQAIEAVSQWKFKPGTKDGAPVPVAATIEVNFRLL